VLPDDPAIAALCRQGLALINAARPFKTVYEDVTIVQETRYVDGLERYRTRLETPVGTLTQEARTDPGYGSRWVTKHFITTAADFDVAEYLFRHMHFEPDLTAWRRADALIGDRGIVFVEIMMVPLMELVAQWMGLETLAVTLHDDPGRLAALLDLLQGHYACQAELAAASPAEAVWIPDNVTATIISPRLFERHVAPVYARYLPLLHGAGKITVAHYDGALRTLVPSIARTELSVMEAFTPPPMGDLTVAEAKAAWPNKVIWINFPGNLFLEPAEVIERYTLELLETGAPGGRLAIGCTEDFPAAEFEKTFAAIGKALARYEGRG
jgi:hypothetical protein